MQLSFSAANRTILSKIINWSKCMKGDGCSYPRVVESEHIHTLPKLPKPHAILSLLKTNEQILHTTKNNISRWTCMQTNQDLFSLGSDLWVVVFMHAHFCPIQFWNKIFFVEIMLLHLGGKQKQKERTVVQSLYTKFRSWHHSPGLQLTG